MNIRNELLKEHSKRQTMKIVRYISNDKARFKKLIGLVMENSPIATQRAAWVLGICGEEHPELVKPYLKQLLLNLKNPVHDAVMRNTLRFLQFIPVPKNLQGLAATICFDLLQSKKEPVAIKVFSMTVLLNICKEENGLANELKLVIEEQLPYSSAGYKSRAKKVLKELERLAETGAKQI